MSFELPIIIHEKNKLFVMAILYTLSVLLYLIAGHYPLLPPSQIPLTAVDNAAPFIPSSIWVYVSEYLFLILAYFSISKTDNLNKYFYSLLGLQIVSFFTFLIWPVAYPRELFPLPDNLDPYSRYMFDVLRAVDAPVNCFPSLHVGWVFLATFTLYDEAKPSFKYYLVWACLIAISTLTTKQHYVLDGVGGFASATVMFWLFHRAFSYRRWSPL